VPLVVRWIGALAGAVAVFAVAVLTMLAVLAMVALFIAGWMSARYTENLLSVH
jgi:HAMP domain-containing protein